MQNVCKLPRVTGVNTMVICEYFWKQERKQGNGHSVFLENGRIISPDFRLSEKKVWQVSLLFPVLPPSNCTSTVE